MSVKEIISNKPGVINNKEVNPYLFAQRQWDFQIMKSYNSLIIWRAIAIITMCLLTFSVVFGYYHIAQPKLVPYVVTVNNDGEVNFKGVINNQKLTVIDSVVRNYLIRFLKDIRTVSSDVVVLKQFLSDAYYISTPDCQHQLTEFIQTAKPFEFQNDKKRRDMKITIFEKVAESTWRCEWIEYVREDGVLTDKVTMSGTFSYTTQFPEDEIQAENNPFGLYFTEFFVTEKRI